MKKKTKLLRLFKKNDHGIALIQTMLLLPIFILFVFAIIDFGFLLAKRYALNNAAITIALAIKNQPDISVADINNLNRGLGMGIVQIDDNDTGITTQTFPFSIPSFNAIALGQRTLNNINIIGTYVGVRVEKTVNFITPLPSLLGIGNSRTLNGRASARIDRLVPNCADGEYLRSAGNGSYECATLPACTQNQFFIWENGQYVCRDVPNCASNQRLKYKTDRTFECVNMTETCRTVSPSITNGGWVWSASVSCGANEYIKEFDIVKQSSGDHSSYNCKGNEEAIAIGGGDHQKLVCRKMSVQRTYKCCKYN